MDGTGTSGNGPCRVDGLLRQDLGDELLVYDPESARTHALSEVSSVVFACCDGTRPPAAIETVLAERTGLAPDRAAVEVALADLHAAGLITWEGAEPPIGMSEESRRDALRKIGVAAGTAVGAPLVYSIIAPTVAAAQSNGGGGGGGGGGGSCPLPTGNLLLNPSFEPDLANWSHFGGYSITYAFIGVVPDPPGSGSSLAMVGAPLNSHLSYIYQDVDVSVAAVQIDSNAVSYSAAGNIAAGYSGPSNPSLPFDLSVEFYDVGNTLIGSPVVIGNAPSPPPVAFVSATGGGTVPALTRKVRLRFAPQDPVTLGGPYMGIADVMSLSFTC